MKLPDRFWAKVNKTETCWLWTASLTKSGGYGQFTLRRGRPERAHRLTWEEIHGPIPEGVSILHSCDTPSCVRPSHLFEGTRTDNARDRDEKGRVAHGEAHYAAKLSEDQIREIRSRWVSYGDLAAAYGVTPSAIKSIVHWRTRVRG